MKQTKNIMKNSEWEKEIARRAKRALQSALIVLIPLGVVWVLLLGLPFFSLLSELFGLGIGIGLCDLLSLVPLAIFMLLPLLAIGLFCYRYAETMGILKRGDWSVETDALSYKVDGESPRGLTALFRVRFRVDRVFYFCRCGRYVTESATFELATSGDPFYVCVLRHRFPTLLKKLPIFPKQMEEIFCAWPSTMYEYHPEQ